MTTKEILEMGRARIARGKCQGAYARTAAGWKTTPSDYLACSWCARGACGFGSQDGSADAVGWLLTAIGAGDVQGLYRFSDTHTQEEVLAVFDKAIELAGAVT